MQDEIEVKVRVEKPQLSELRAALSTLGFRQAQARTFEENYLLDFRDDRLRNEGCALRLRRYGSERLLTYKGPKKDDPTLKIRQEIETRVEDLGGVLQILRALGLDISFEYSKFREKWAGRLDRRAVEICLDETPVGCFVEIEGDREAIEGIAREFGWQTESFITKNYVDLYREATRI